MASGETTVALLGTGLMGAAMAPNLVAGGYAVKAWNRTREKAEAVAGDGVEVADTPAEAASGASAVITMLHDAGAVEAAMTGADGAIDALDGAPWVQMSTIGVAGTERMKVTAAEREISFVDAPVVGTREPAEKGELQVLASGPDDEELRGVCDPIFAAVGKSTMWLGEAGAGTRLKLVVNTWILSLVEGLGETVGLARALGVDPERFLETIDGGPLGPPYAQTKGRMMIDDEFPVSFALSGALKDAELVLEAAADLELPIAQAAAQQMRRAEELGHGEEDMAAVARVSGSAG